MFDPFKKLVGIETKSEKKEREERERQIQVWQSRMQAWQSRFVFDPSVTPHEEKTLSGHSSSVNALTLLSDGRLASGSSDKTIKLWNVSSGACERTLSGHSSSVDALTLLSDGRLASGSDDKTIKLWNVLSGACERTLPGHSSGVCALTVLSDGRLASGSWDETIKLWSVSSGACERTLSGHSNWVRALTLLSDGRLASGSNDKTIKLWNVLSGECERTLSGHSSYVFALTLLSDGCLASGSYDKTIKLWNVSSGECERTLSGHIFCVTALTLLSDGRLASGSLDNTIKFWNVGLTLKLILQVAATSTPNLQQPIAATGAAKKISIKNNQKENNLIEEKKVKEANESSKEITVVLEEDALKIKLYNKFISQPNEWIWKISRNEIVKDEYYLGEGSAGKVYHDPKYKDVAFKIHQGGILPDNLQTELNHELRIMKQLDCVYLLKLYGVLEDLLGKNYGLVLEYCSGGALYDRLHSSQELPWSTRIVIAQDIARGLEHLHGKSIVHADLKSLNVLLTNDKRAKISDFGISLSKVKSHLSSVTTSTAISKSEKKPKGTYRWMAPELFNLEEIDFHGEANSQASDIYALGVTFWELITRQIPYNDIPNLKVLILISKGIKEKFPENCSSHWQELIESCWQEKRLRPSAQKIVEIVMQWSLERPIAKTHVSEGEKDVAHSENITEETNVKTEKLYSHAEDKFLDKNSETEQNQTEFLADIPVKISGDKKIILDLVERPLNEVWNMLYDLKLKHKKYRTAMQKNNVTVPDFNDFGEALHEGMSKYLSTKFNPWFEEIYSLFKSESAVYPFVPSDFRHEMYSYIADLIKFINVKVDSESDFNIFLLKWWPSDIFCNLEQRLNDLDALNFRKQQTLTKLSLTERMSYIVLKLRISNDLNNHFIILLSSIIFFSAILYLKKVRDLVEFWNKNILDPLRQSPWLMIYFCMDAFFYLFTRFIGAVLFLTCLTSKPSKGVSKKNVLWRLLIDNEKKIFKVIASLDNVDEKAQVFYTRIERLLGVFISKNKEKEHEINLELEMLEERGQNACKDVRQLCQTTEEMKNWSLQFFFKPAECNPAVILRNKDKNVKVNNVFSSSVSKSEEKHPIGDERKPASIEKINTLLSCCEEELRYSKELLEIRCTLDDDLAACKARANSQEASLKVLNSRIDSWMLWQEQQATTIRGLSMFKSMPSMKTPSCSDVSTLGGNNAK